MKRVQALFLIMAMMCCLLAGCGNMSMGFGEFTFNHLHFTNHNESHCATIEKWYDNSNGIEVKTKEYGSMYLSESTYMLFGEAKDCPFCVEEAE